MSTPTPGQPRTPTPTVRSSIQGYEDIRERINSLPWVLDGIEEEKFHYSAEKESLDKLLLATEETTSKWRGITQRLLEMQWIQGPIEVRESNAISQIYSITWTEDEGLKERFINFPWLQDKISEDESTALEGLQWLLIEDTGGVGNISDWRRNEESLMKVLTLPWVQDGITKMEAEILLEAGKVSNHSYGTISAVLDMPFIRVPNDMDEIVIWALRGLIIHEIAWEVLHHSRFQEGITDENAVMFAATAFVIDKEEIRRMLEPGYANIETLSRGTSLTP